MIYIRKTIKRCLRWLINMARKLNPRMEWISGELSRRLKGKSYSKEQRAKIFRQVSREAKRRFGN